MAEKLNIREEITPEMITKSLEGRDPEERIVNIDYNNQDDFVTVFYRNEKDEKCSHKVPFHPFCWATKKACLKLCDGDRQQIKKLLSKYKIKCDILSNRYNDGTVCEEMNDGYMFIFRALEPMSYTKFLSFFKEAKNPIYGDSKKGEENLDNKNNQYLIASANEQFLISTGKRFFKGYDDYNQLLRMGFDLETEGLDPKRHRIEWYGISFNRPVTYKGKTKEFSIELQLQGETKEEKDINELKMIDTALRIIYTFFPDVITAHNGENFDWNFIIERCHQLGSSIEEVSAKYFDGRTIGKRKKESTLKLGGEVQHFFQTIVPNIIVTDSLHAVWRAQATDSNFAQADLKYATKYLNLTKKNRVYTPGDKISEISNDFQEHYAFNNENGDWYLYDPNAPTKEKVVADPSKNIEFFTQEARREIYKDYENFIYETIENEKVNENYEPIGEDDIFAEIQEEVDLMEVYGDEYKSKYTFENYLKDEKISPNFADEGKKRYDDYISSINEANTFKKGKEGDKPFIMYTRNYIAEGYKLVNGHYIIERYLQDDVDECMQVEAKLNGPEFFLTKFLPIPFSKVATMGTAGQWKAIMMNWSYENGLAIPKQEDSGKFTGGLSKVCFLGWIKKQMKADYNSLYPSIELTWEIMNKWDLSNAMLMFLNHFLATREVYKGKKKDADNKISQYNEKILNNITLNSEEKMDYEIAKGNFAFFDNFQMFCKRLCNSYFGSLGSRRASVFPWKNQVCAERTTCTGRMCLRLMIYHFSEMGKWRLERGDLKNNEDINLYNYKAIVGDTDGFNLEMPQKFYYTKDNPYIAKGNSRVTKKGKEYVDYEADVAEFNELFLSFEYFSKSRFMRMGMDIDELISNSINVSRKNYLDFFDYKPYPKDIKIVGNTLKGKKNQNYIKKLFDEALRPLVKGDGKTFLDKYYQTLDKIFNYNIPLRDIASKGKVKKYLDEYVKDCSTLTKAGRPKSRQAWMELALKENLNVNVGDVIYYINVGKTKSQADVKKVTHYFKIEEDGTKKEMITQIEREFKKYKKEAKERGEKKILDKSEYISQNYPYVVKEDEIILNAVLLPRELVESDIDYYCEEGKEYNVAKYVDMFNNKVKPFLVCFSKDIRNRILITNPSDRPYFTEEEMILTSGEPNKPGDQDTYEQLMTLEDKEIKFWKAHPEFEIPYLKECNMNWDEIVSDYDRRMEEEKRMGIDIVRQKYQEALDDLSKEEIEKFIEDGELPSGLDKVIDIDPISGNFVCKEHPEVTIGTIGDLIEKSEENDENEDE